MPGQTVHYVGGTKHFECRVKGHPRPTIRWFKDDVEITDSPRYQFGHAHDGIISMVIEDIAHEDEGHYRCRAENSEGLASTSAYLFVRTHKEHPEEAETSIHAMKIEQARNFTEVEKKERKASLARQDSEPHFEKPIEDVDKHGKERRLSAEEEEIVKKSFEQVIKAEIETSSESVTNRPIQPDVTSKEAEIEKSTKGDVASNGHRGSITLQRISEGSESTQESVKTTNDEASERGSLLMRQTKRIISQDLGSEKDSLDSRRASEVERSLSEDVFDLAGFEATHSKTTVTKTEVKGGSITETTVVTSESTTEKSGQSITKTEVKESFSEKKVVSSEASSEKSGKSLDEVDSMKVKSKEKVNVEEKSVSPLLEMVSVPKQLEEGMDLKLEIKVVGEPKPKVSWTKDGTALKIDNKRIIMIWSAEVITLEVKKITAKDAGTYALLAENTTGESTLSITVSISEKSKQGDRAAGASGAPQFTMKPQGPVEIEEFEKMNLELAIDGDPAPKVSWSKDGKPIKSNRRVRLSERNGVHSLEVSDFELGDAGLYVCQAENDKGSATMEIRVSMEGVVYVTADEDSPDTRAEKKRKQGKYYADDATDSSRDTDSSSLLVKTEVSKTKMKDETEFSLSVEEGEMTESDRRRRSGTGMESSSDERFLKCYALVKNYTDQSSGVSFRSGQLVEVLDSKEKSGQWLVRGQSDKEKVCFVPTDLLRKVGEEELPDAMREEETDEESSVQKKRRPPQSPKPGTPDVDIDTSEDEFGLLLSHPDYVAIADYNPSQETIDSATAAGVAPLRLSEGQVVEVLDMQRADSWLVRARPTKTSPARQGWVPSSYLAEKAAAAEAAARRTTRETFRDEVLQVNNKQQEAGLKRSPDAVELDEKSLLYVLKELAETEQEYVNELKTLTDAISSHVTSTKQPLSDTLKTSTDVIFSNVVEIFSFHEGQFLNDVRECIASPSTVGSTFLSRQAEFERYGEFLDTRDKASFEMDTEEVKAFIKEMGKKSVESEQAIFELVKKPTERLKMYELLLKDILRYTVRIGEDSAQLEGAIAMLVSIQKAVTSRKLVAQLDSYEGDITQLSNIIRHDDCLVWEGDASATSKAKERHVFLFADQIIMTRKRKPDSSSDQATFTYKGALELQDVRLNETVSGDERRLELWYYQTGEDGTRTVEKFTLQARSVHAKQAWARDIREALLALGITDPDVMPEVTEEEGTGSRSPNSPETKDGSDEAVTEVKVGRDEVAKVDETDKKSEKTAAAQETKTDVKPFFTQELKKVVSKEGTAARLECRVGGSPAPTVVWTKGDKPIESGEGITISFEADVSSVQFEKVKANNGGSYTVTVSNSSGSCSASVDLVVVEDSPETDSTSTTVTSGQVGDTESGSETPTEVDTERETTPVPGDKSKPEVAVEEETLVKHKTGKEESAPTPQTDSEQTPESEAKPAVAVEEEIITKQEAKKDESKPSSDETVAKLEGDNKQGVTKNAENKDKKLEEEKSAEDEKKAEEERKKKLAEEAEVKRKAEEKRAEEEKKAEEERKKKLAEEEEAKRKEEEKKKEEEKRKEDERIKEEKKRKEEERLKEEERRKAEEKRKEEEKKAEEERKAEEKRKEDERSKEEEKKRKAEEERKKKEEEEKEIEKARKAKEEQERLEKEKAEEKRKQKEEEEKKKEETRKAEEEKKRLEKEKEEEERKLKEEEARKAEEEQKRLEEEKAEKERKQKEEEEKKKEEARKAEEEKKRLEEEKAEKERKQKEEEEKKKEEARKAEEEKKRLEEEKAEKERKQKEEEEKKKEEARKSEEQKRRLAEEKAEKEKKQKEEEERKAEEEKKRLEKEKADKEKKQKEEEEKKKEEAKKAEEAKKKQAEEEEKKRKELEAKKAKEKKEEESKELEAKKNKDANQDSEQTVELKADTAKKDEQISEEKHEKKGAEKIKAQDKESSETAIQEEEQKATKAKEESSLKKGEEKKEDTSLTKVEEKKKEESSLKKEEEKKKEHTSLTKEEEKEKEDTSLPKEGEKKEEEGKPARKPAAPQVIDSMDDIVIELGDLARFDCRVSAYPDPEITWFKDGNKVIPSTKYELLNFHDDIFSLLIKKVKDDDSGRYTCVAKNEYGEAKSEALLNVVGLREKITDAHVAPEFLTKFYDMEAVEGLPVEFVCVIDGNPEPQVTWLLNGKEVEIGADILSRRQEDSVMLAFRSVQIHHEGEVICKLKNDSGEAICKARLKVKEDIGKRGDRPVFIERPSDKEVNEGGEVTFECVISGLPDPEVTWYFNGRELYESRRRTMKRKAGQKYVLTIRECIPENAGVYTCKARNRAGDESCAVELSVKEAPTERELKGRSVSATDFDAAKYAFPPSFTRRIRDVGVLPGRMARFEAMIIGVPEPEVEWMKDGFAVRRGPKYTIGMEGHTAILVVENCDTMDEGHYTCNLYNDAGKASCTAQLKVQEERTRFNLPRFISPALGVDGYRSSPSPAPAPKKSMTRSIPPEDKIPSMSIDKPVILESRAGSCKLSWMPAPTTYLPENAQNITYIVEAREQPSKQWVRLAGGIEATTYVAQGLKPDKEYNFRVKAENRYGTSESTLPTTMLAREEPRGRDIYRESETPSRPVLPRTKPYVSDIGKETIRLGWKPAELSLPHAGRSLSVPPPVSYRVEAQKLPSEEWIPLASRVKKPSLYLSDLESDRDYNIRVRAQTPYGVSQPTESLWIPRAKSFTGVPVSRPTIVEIEENTARLQWHRVDIPAFDRSEDPLLYMVEMQEPPGYRWRELARRVPTTYFTVRDLEPSQDYRFRVRAETTDGLLSEPSPATSIFRTLALTHTPVDNVEVDDYDEELRSARLSWRRVEVPPYGSNDEPLLYMIEYEEPTRQGWRSLVSGIPTTRYRVPDISPTENYRFRVRALSPYGVSPPSYPTGLYRRMSPMRPLAQDLHLSDLKPDSLRLSWRSASVPPTSATPPSYQIEALQYPERQWRPLASDIRDTSYQLRGLKPSSDYSFRVRAQTPSGLAEPTAPVTLTSMPVRPRLPIREPIISDLGLDSVRLTWKPAELPYYSRQATPITYTVDYQEIPSREWIVAGRSIPETSYTIRGLNPERDYRFRITPETEFGPGEPSLPVLARRHVAPVFPRREPLLSNITPTSATLSWSPATFPAASSLSTRPITYRVEAREPPSSVWSPLSGGRGLSGYSYDLQFLHPDQDYMFRVVAECGEFESEPSMTAYLPHRAGPPKMPRDAPQASSVQPDSLFLSWRSVELPSRITDYSPVTYRIEVQEGLLGHWSPLARQINMTHHHVTGLKPDVTYNFRVRAENSFGISDPTDPVLVSKRAVAPTLSEHEPLISDVRPDSLRLTWKPAELPSYLTDTVPVTYTILMQEPGDHSWSPIARRVSGTSYYVTGLLPDRDYSFRVQAENNYGTSLPSFPSRLHREVKGPIYSPEIEDVEPSSFRLSWRSPSVSKPTTYAIETLEPSTWKWRPLVSRLPHPSYKVTNVTPGTDYAFRVRAEVDSVITEPSLPISFSNRRVLSRAMSLPPRHVKAPPLIPVERPTLSEIYEDSVRVNWHPILHHGSTLKSAPQAFRLEVRELPDTYWRTLIPNTDAWSYEVTSLRPDQDYAFRVRTVSDTGMSEPSLPVYLYRKAATPKIPLPSPEISDVGDNYIALKWNKVDVPAFDYDETPLSFMIEAQSVPDYNWKPVARGVTGASHRVTGLEPKRDYQFRLRGETSLGLTQPSTPVPAYRTPLSSGVPIVNVKVDRDSNLPYSARLRWNPVYIPPYSPTRGGTTYAIEMQEPPRTDWYTLAQNVSSTSYTVPELSPRRDYMFRIRARSVDGDLSAPTPPVPHYRVPESSWANLPALTGSGLEYTPINRPYIEGLIVKVPPRMSIEKPEMSLLSPDCVQLSWRAARVPPATATLSPTTYRVEGRHEDSFEWIERATNITGLSTEIKGLNPHVEYAFRVRAINDFGWSESTLPVFLHRAQDLKDAAVELEFEEIETMGSIFGDTSPPKMPMDTPRMGIVQSDGSMKLSWTQARIPVYARKTPITYSVEKKEPLDQDWVVVVDNLEDNQYLVTGIEPQQDYLFRVKAHNEFGASEATLPAALTRSKTPKFIRNSASRERELEVSASQRRSSSSSYSYIDSISTGVPPRVPQGRPSMSDIKDTSLTLSWQPGRMPSYIKGPVKISYIVECREPPNHLWNKLNADVGGTSYKVTNLRADQDYMFRVRAFNDSGMSEPTLPVTLTRERVVEAEPRTMRRRSSVERFASVERRTSRERSMSMDRGSSVPRAGLLSREGSKRDVDEEDMFAGQTPDTTPAAPEFVVEESGGDTQHGIDSRPVKITLQLRGVPLPNVEWYFKDKKIMYGDRHEGYVTPTGLAVLEFAPMGWDDVGDYRCVAENDEGEASFTVKLQMSDPPTFLKPIRDLHLKTMASDRFQCQVDGMPFPSVKFMKDWRPLTETSRQKVVQDGSVWHLEVDQAIPADSGCYICVAENPAGKVFCTARLVVDDDLKTDSITYKKTNLEDDYYILEELGRGRHSIVRRVLEKHTGKEFAAKFTQVREECDKDFFRQELDALVRQTGQNVQRLHDAYETQRQLILVLESVKQGNVIDRVLADKEWTEVKAAQVVRSLVLALQAVHTTHYLHLDVKPSNLRFTSNDLSSLRLTDFGFSRKLPLSKDLEFNFGTPEFCSPEAVNNEAVTSASDIWAVGVITHLLLTGVSPFSAPSVPDILSKTQTCDWKRDDPAFKALTSDAQDFITKILVRDPQARLSAEACLEHPWLKEGGKAGTKKLDTSKHQSFRDRFTTEQITSEVKTVACLRTLSRLMEGPTTIQGLKPMTDDQTGDVILPDTEEYGEFLDEESWYDWQSRHQQGPDTELFPLKDASYTLRVRGYKRASGSVDESAAPVYVDSDEELDPQDKERLRTMKERVKMAEIDKEEIPPSLEKELEWLEEKRKRRRKSREADEFSLASKRSSIASVTSESTPGLPGPYFKEKLHNLAFGVDDTVILRCVVAGPPTPTCVWYKNEELLTEGNRLKVNLEEDGEATLTIRNAKPYDAGVYKCVGRNKHGRVSNRMRLSVGDVPGRPGQPVVSQVSSTEAMVIWEAPLSDGHSDILFYKVDYKSTDKDRWSSGIYTTLEATIITGLAPGTNYRFRVSATNRFGTSHYSWSSVEVSTKPEGSKAIDTDDFFDVSKLRSGQCETQPALPTEHDDIIPEEELAQEKPEISIQKVKPDTVYNISSLLFRGKFYEDKSVTLPSQNDKAFTMRSVFSQSSGLHQFETLRSLKHERLACLCDAFSEATEKDKEGIVHLVFEHLQGDHVTKHLSMRRKYSEEMVASVIRQVLYGLEYLHGQNILHLNLQPASVVVSALEGCEVKVTDFSLARPAVSPHGEKVPRLGHADFIAPEIITQDLVSFSADVWGVGVLTFVLLSGTSPFHDVSYEATLVNTALNRYDAVDLYENITTEALKFLYKVMKRMPRNRLSVRECLEHKWLQLTDKIVKDREDTVFLTNTLAKFVADYDAARQAEDFRQDFQADILPIQMSKAIPFEMTTADVSKPPTKGKGLDVSFQEPESRPSTSARSIRTLEERLQESLQRIEDATKRGVDTIMLPAESQVSPAATADATKMEIPAEPSHSEMSETVTESATEESSGRITRSEELKEKASSLEDKIISKAEAEEKSQADQKKDSSQEKKAEEKPKQEVTKTQEEQKEDAGTEKKAEDKPKEEVVKTQEEEKKDAGKEEKAEEKSEHAVTLEHAQKVADEVVSEKP